MRRIREAFGWAVVNGYGDILLPTESTRVGAIRSFVSGHFDQQVTGSALTDDEFARWRWWKRRHNAACIRVEVSPAFRQFMPLRKSDR